MPKRRTRHVVAIFLAVFLCLNGLSMLVSRFSRPSPRTFAGVRLADTRYQEVSFRNEAQALMLAGMLFVPAGEGPFPGAVIIHGSGTSRRDSGWYLTLTESLQENGIVVLLPDKRGSARSEGDWRTASLEDLATDTLAAVSFLRRQKTVGVTDLGVIGMSQGGHIAPIVGSRTPDVAFVVNIVGGAVPMHELLVYEETHNLRQMGILPGVAHLLAYPASWGIRNVAQQPFWDAVGNFDPLPYWQRLSVPCLVLYGERDTNVPSRRSAAVLQSLGKPNIDVRIYPGSGHALESPEGEGNRIFREDALQDIREFILASTSSARP